MRVRVADKTKPGRGKSALPGFEALCREHRSYVLNLVRWLVGPRRSAEAEDLAQEILLIAMRKFPNSPDIGSPKAWLEAIAVRVVANARRTRWFHGVFTHSGMAGALIDWRSPDMAVEDKQATFQLYEMLERLTEKKRVVFILHEIMGLTAPEIARAVDCPLNTVYARLRHARSEVMVMNESRRRREEAL